MIGVRRVADRYVEAMTTHFRTCPLCEAMCGLEIETEGDRVTRVRGDRGRRLEQGLPLPEGCGARASCTTTPTGSARRWSATATTGARCRGPRRSPAARSCSSAVVADHGRDAVTAYLGNPNVHSYSLSRYSGAVPGLGGHAGHLVGRHRRPVAEEPGVRPALRRGVEHPDPRRGQHRPARDHGRQPARLERIDPVLPRPRRRARRIRERGGRTIVVDPRRTGTAERADEWLPIVPGTDAALLLAVVAVLDEDGSDRPRRGRRAGQGVDEVLAAARAFPPEAVARVVRRRRRAHPRAGPRARRRPTRGGLRAHRPVHPGVRHAGVAGWSRW